MTRAGSLELSVAAPAARPLTVCPRKCRRGVRSRAARVRRRQLWCDRVLDARDDESVETFFGDCVDAPRGDGRTNSGFDNPGRIAQTPIPASNLGNYDAGHFSVSGSRRLYGQHVIAETVHREVLQGENVSGKSGRTAQTPMLRRNFENSEAEHFSLSCPRRLECDHLGALSGDSQSVRGAGIGRFGVREAQGSIVPGQNFEFQACGQSQAPTIDVDSSLFHLHVRGFRENYSKIDSLLRLHHQPHFVAITETWLTKATESVSLSGYHLISRLDRRTRQQCGGIAFFALDGYETSIVHIADSPVDERSWHILHSDYGPILVCVWYRRPDYNELDSIRRFDQELGTFMGQCVATICVGDFNVHNEEWLRYSHSTTPEGRELEDVCSTNGLRQHVREPTRGDYLLDLVLSNFASGLTAKVVAGIHDNDHRATIARIKVHIAASSPVRRTVFDFKHADWEHLRAELRDVDWQGFFSSLDADNAALRLTDTILDSARRWIPEKVIFDKLYAHPWLNDDCVEALRRKHAAIGTTDFTTRRDECSTIFREAYRMFVRKTRDELKSLSPSSRGWWKLAGSLLARRGGAEAIPPLLRTDDSWAMTAKEKADEFATVFRDKAVLGDEEVNEYTPLSEHNGASQRGFLRLRVRTVKRLLKRLDASSGTGPDLLPARLLKECFEELALPVTLLARQLVAERRWPLCWRHHWVHPIFKRKSKADAKNYRGVHLTPQLSKVVERAVASLFLPFIDTEGLFGPHQYAYGKGRGYKDALFVNTCTWLLRLEEGFALGLYCSDVSGAFDRVSRTRLCDKLRITGLHPDIVGFLESWLEDREARTIVGGKASRPELLANSVFQGTVLGPPLWNLFFEDTSSTTHKGGYSQTTFADDLNTWRAFGYSGDVSVPAFHRDILDDLKATQSELHVWGRANRVSFDVSKESLHILHRRFPHGNDFKILGVMYDTKLLMHSAARVVATEAGWRLQSLLHAKQFFSMVDLFRLYKSQILSYIESSTSAVYHASTTVVHRIDRVQLRFLREIGCSEFRALAQFRLAPLESRRDISMLGALHRVVLGCAPPQAAALFPVLGVVDEPFRRQFLRHWRPLHNRQMATPVTFASTDVLKRSVFGLVRCYNRLPQEIVDISSVKKIQRRLQLALIGFAKTGAENWQRLFSVQWQRMHRGKFHDLFVGR